MREARSTGMTRKVDELGAWSSPANSGSGSGSTRVTISPSHVEEERIVLTKVETGCVFCDSTDDLVSYRDKLICQGLQDGHRRDLGLSGNAPETPGSLHGLAGLRREVARA